jgi:hypothetical protein
MSGVTGGNPESPYIGYSPKNANTTLFSPNRQVPSPVILGSLPTGINQGSAASTVNGRRTLLLSPNPNAGSFGGTHFSLTTDPRDYLLLDLFTMRVVEP